MGDVKRYDVVVLGGGSGLTAAHHAWRAGRTVAVIEEHEHALGGTCVNRGCIPTKGLLHAADVADVVHAAHEHGIVVDPAAVRVDFLAIMEAMRTRRAADAAAVKTWVDKELFPFYERARFVDDRVLELEDGRRVAGDTVFVAAGARPALPPIPGLDAVGVWTSDDVLELRAQPSSVAILGGGYIGVELGHFFSALGTRVTVIEREGCLLGEDDDVRRLFTEVFSRRVDLRTGHEAVAAAREGGTRALTVRRRGERVEQTLRSDGLVVATGRRPATAALGLEATGVKLDEHGWVVVDEHLRTSNPRVYAYGDVIGRAMFKHTSSYEGEVAYRHSQGEDVAVSYRANPHAVFSRPQIAAVGLTERECRESDRPHRVYRKDFAEIARGRIEGEPEGFAKLVVDPDSDRILGFHVIGPGAAELVHEVVVAMTAGDGTASAVRRAIHIHPTRGELVRAVFDAAG